MSPAFLIALAFQLACVKQSDAGRDTDAASDSAASFECGVTVPDGLRPAATDENFGGESETCAAGLEDALLTTATDLDSFVEAREACSGLSLSEYGRASDAVDWGSEYAIAATESRNVYGWRLGAIGADTSGSVTHVDWCLWHPLEEADSPGTYLVVYGISSESPTTLESTETTFDEG